MIDDDQMLADFLGLPRPQLAQTKIAPAKDTPSREDVPERAMPTLAAMLLEQRRAQPDRMPWPDDWFQPCDPGDAAACRRLWAAALLACIRDSITTISTLERQQFGRHGVPSGWVGSRDFHMMCSLAGVDGQAVADRLAQIHRDPEMAERILRIANPKHGARNDA